nr:MAG TPA: capsid scaffolding protein [Caudoviricetes sp.]
MDIQDKLKLKLQFFADESNEVDENNDETTGEGERKEKDEKTYSEEEFNQRLNDELKRRMKQKEQEKQDAIEEAKKLAKMNKDQQEEYENEKLRKENDELRNKQARYEMRDIARKMLNERDIKANDEILDFVVSTDADETQEKIESFSKILNDMVQAKVKESLRQGSPKNVSSSGMSKQDILNIKDDMQRQQAIARNRHLFN